jgi:hypothetical protein
MQLAMEQVSVSWNDNEVTVYTLYLLLHIWRWYLNLKVIQHQIEWLCLVCDAVWSGRCLLTFRRNVFPTSRLKGKQGCRKWQASFYFLSDLLFKFESGFSTFLWSVCKFLLPRIVSHLFRVTSTRTSISVTEDDFKISDHGFFHGI